MNANGSQNIREGIEGHAVNWYSDVFNIVFADLDKHAANQLWKDKLISVKEATGGAATE